MTPIMRQILTSKRVYGKDTFSRPDGALGSAEKGGLWTVVAGSFAISSSIAQANASASTCLVTLSIDKKAFMATLDIGYRLGTGNNATGICLFSDNTTNNWMFYKMHALNVLQLQRKISGVSTTIASTTVPAFVDAAWHTLKLIYKDNVFSCYYDGVLKFVAIDDNALKVNNTIGIAGYYDGTDKISYDNFKVEAI